MPNRLAETTSPYLLQHAHNPVDWYPWGPEALAHARDEDRPILLSIGYSACHWCHVMERESFEDPATAELMNARFVNVKVDREERPDVDQIYMRAVQSMTGSGGWPLTAFLTPDGEPYYGGTYFPPEPRHGMPSFRQVLEAAADAWTHRRGDVQAAADRLVEALRAAAAAGDGPGGAVPDDAALDRAVEAVAARYDRTHGGFGGAPKFPQPTTLEALLRHHLRTGQPHTLEMVVHTLRRMAAGGIHDHLGGGFHRYSVDARWLVPHFEKMLYDNALLARLYLDAWKVSGAEDLRAVCTATLDYVVRDLQAAEGGFYAARDADSEGEEGLFYVWTPEELTELLGDDAEAAMAAWGVTPGGNFEGRSILHLPADLDTAAERMGRTRAELDALLDRARATLLEARATREPPFRDEKILVAWTAMTVRALAEAGAALDRPDWLDAARRAARFVLDRMRPDGRLHRVHTAGRTHQPAFLEDHAALGNALLSLHEATLEPQWLEGVRDACETILSAFADPDTGRLWDTAADAESLVVRPRDPTDTATPSGHSLAAELLARAGHLFDDDRYREAAASAVASEASNLLRFPTAFGRLQAVADRLNAPPVEVAIVGGRDEAATRALLGAASRTLLRSLVVTGRAPDEPSPDLPLLAGREVVDGRPAAYVCRRYACRAPVTDASALAAELRAGGVDTVEG